MAWLPMPEAGVTGQELLWQDPAQGLVMLASRTPSTAWLEYLGAQYFGGQGLRYRRPDVAAALAGLADPRFIALEQHGRVAGSYVVAGLPLHTPHGPAQGYYRGLLSVAPQLQGRGLGRRLVEVTLAWLAAQAAASGAPSLSWGCIEGGNGRSLNTLLGAGARELGTLESATLYRQWPRERLAVQCLDTGREPGLAAAVRDSHGDCALAPGLGGGGVYFAHCTQSGILAGARVHRTQVDLHTIGGAWDMLDRYLLRYSKAARKRFDPHCFTYLSLSDLVVRPGHERLWADFLSTLLARHGAYMAMLVTDPRSELHARLARAGLFGRLSRIARQRLRVVGSAWNWPAAPEELPGEGPTALGPVGF